jgi:hypothetical protein
VSVKGTDCSLTSSIGRMAVAPFEAAVAVARSRTAVPGRSRSLIQHRREASDGDLRACCCAPSVPSCHGAPSPFDSVFFFSFTVTPIIVDVKVLTGRREGSVAQIVADRSQIHLLIRHMGASAVPEPVSRRLLKAARVLFIRIAAPAQRFSCRLRKPP